MHKFIVSLALALVATRALSASDAEIAELRRQVEALTRTVATLQQQVNQQRLAPMFGTGQPRHGGKTVVATESHAEHAPVEHEHDRFELQTAITLDFIGSYSRSADNVNFIMRNAEVLFQADVDRFAHAYLLLNAETELAPTEKTDPFEDNTVGIEEAAIETTSLPFGLKLKAGKFYANVTRLGTLHSHDLPFTDRPRSLDLILGGEPQARGVELSWMPPIDRKIRLTLGAVDHVGAEPTVTRRLYFLDEGDGEFGSAFASSERRGFDQLTFYGRAATVFDFGSQAQFHLGANYLHGRDDGVRTLASADARFTWQPRWDSFDQFELGGEYLWSRTEGRLANEASSSTAHARGGYAYAQYRIGKHFQPGVRFDFVHPESFEEVDLDGDGESDGIDRVRDDVFTYSAYVNWHFSEANRLRLQLNYVKGQRDVTPGSDDDWQAFLQWTVLFGAHEHSPAW